MRDIRELRFNVRYESEGDFTDVFEAYSNVEELEMEVRGRDYKLKSMDSDYLHYVDRGRRAHIFVEVPRGLSPRDFASILSFAVEGLER